MLRIVVPPKLRHRKSAFVNKLITSSHYNLFISIFRSGTLLELSKAGLSKNTQCAA
jgi:hypothetical protein